MNKSTNEQNLKLLWQVKQVLACDIEETVNSLLSSEDWKLLHVYHRKDGNGVYLLGRISG